MKIRVKSGEIPFSRMSEKLWKTQTVADLHLNQLSLQVIQYPRFSHNKHGKRFEDIKTQI